MKISYLPILLLGLSFDAVAHPQDMGLLKVTTQNSSLDVTLELAVPVAATVTGIDSVVLTDASKLTSKGEIFLQATLAEAQIQTPAGECKWGGSKMSPAPQSSDGKVRLIATARCSAPLTSWSLELPFLLRTNRGFELLVQIDSGKERREFVASAEDDHIVVSNQIDYPWTRFIGMGVHHIGAAPSEWRSEKGIRLPDGIDHILFVLALVLGGGGLIGILKTVTGFTIGHSFTLALATLGVLHFPSRIVESAIALSIAVVAGETLFLKRNGDHWRIAFAFGLVHGLGFATALSELHLDRSSLLKALVGFNVGVEAGQAIIVSIALPILMLLKNLSFTKKWAVPVCSGLVFVAGSYWFFRRALGI